MAHTEFDASVGEQVLLAYRDLIAAEARLGEALAPRGIRVGSSVADQWPTLHDYLNLYARGLSPAGVVVFGGRPDAGSRATGIPFTGPAQARDLLGLPASGSPASPSAEAFWGAVESARLAREAAPIESLFGTVHLAHAIPFDVDATPERARASARHVLRILSQTRPQAAVAVGQESLATLGHAVRDADLVSLARAPEASWLERWPPGTRVLACPRVEVPLARPFRMHVIPIPALDGPRAWDGARSLERLFAHVLA